MGTACQDCGKKAQEPYRFNERALTGDKGAAYTHQNQLTPSFTEFSQIVAGLHSAFHSSTIAGRRARRGSKLPAQSHSPLGHLKTDEVADVVQVTKVRILRALERRGVVRVSPEALEVDDAFAARDPVLAQLAAAAVAGLSVPSGPGPLPTMTALRLARLGLPTGAAMIGLSGVGYLVSLALRRR